MLIGSNPARLLIAASTLIAGLGFVTISTATAQVVPEPNPGQFFLIEEPIDSDAFERIKLATKQIIARSIAQKTARPILIFEIRPGRSLPGSSGFGTSFELANYLSTELAGARLTVAYVPEPLQGYAVLPALACDEIVMGPNASIGPITPKGQEVKADYREPIRLLARRKGRDPDLYAGLLDTNADLKVVQTADRQVHYVLPESLPEFLKTNQVADQDIKDAWEGGSRGEITARRAREEGFSKLTADNRAEIANVYHLGTRALADDPTLLQEPRPVWIQIDGRIDPIKEAYLRRRVEQARREGVNLVFFQINSQGGLNTSANNVATLIADIQDMKTIAFVDDRATGVSALIALACDEIVFRRGSQMGGVRQLITGRNDQVQDLTEGQIDSLTKRAEGLATQKGHPSAVAHAMVDSNARIVQATDSRSGAAVLVLEAEASADPIRYLNPSTVKEPGEVLVVRSGEAGTFGLGEEVEDVEGFKALYGLRGKTIRVDGPTWVDGLVTTLNDPFVSWVILFVGVFMLILEIKMPGVGLPAVISALAFLLFFWSRYLSGTADQLEILLFLVGLICLGLELFVFPGFGVFGLSGFTLVVTSIVMASHTFIWPTQEYEYRQMAGTLFQVVAVMVGVGVGAALVGKYIPSLPIFNRMVLKPETYNGSELDDPMVKPPTTEAYESLAFLMGETGRSTTVLRPTGKARFGNLLVEVLADGYYIERDTLIEVVDVQGMKVIVKPVA
ncbi:NfeD family protein [Tundrisphaera lichenicola]|uniref:NfeD family protein n=1 Tax=Tundrisphaera lichenicola TaxID=2029860 RepID=UPI003EBDF6D2